MINTIRAYMQEGCGACQKQHQQMDLDGVEYVTDRQEMVENDVEVTPTMDVQCNDGSTHRVTGVTSDEDLRGVCRNN